MFEDIFAFSSSRTNYNVSYERVYRYSRSIMEGAETNDSEHLHLGGWMDNEGNFIIFCEEHNN